MNSNLHKLHLRANELAFEQACRKNGVKNPQQHTIFNEYVEIFGELVIRACLEHIEPMQGSGDLDDVAFGAAQREIMEHFGIK